MMSPWRVGYLVAGVAGWLIAGCAGGPARSVGPSSRPTVSLRFHFADEQPREGYEPLADEEGKPLYVSGSPILTEGDLVRVSRLEGHGHNLILLEFKPLAAERLAALTAQNVGQRLAIFIDDRLVMSPLIREPITRGKVLMDGDFSRARAEEIVRALSPGQPSAFGRR